MIDDWANRPISIIGHFLPSGTFVGHFWFFGRFWPSTLNMIIVESVIRAMIIMIITNPLPLSIISHLWPLLDLDHRLFLTTGYFRPIEIFDRLVVTSHNIYFRHFYFTLYCQWVYYYCFCLFIYFISVREIGQRQQPARQNVSHRCFVPPLRFRSIQHSLLQ